MRAGAGRPPATAAARTQAAGGGSMEVRRQPANPEAVLAMKAGARPSQSVTGRQSGWRWLRELVSSRRVTVRASAGPAGRTVNDRIESGDNGFMGSWHGSSTCLARRW